MTSSTAWLPQACLVSCLVSLASATVVTITVAPVIPSSVPQFKDSHAFASAVINSTNVYRRQHNASAVAWNDTLARFASHYLDQTRCRFKHSGGPYGENLAMGYPDAMRSVEVWGDERKDYDFAAGGFSHATGHFTQLVWRKTTDVGCGRRLCGRKGWYVVCEYWPRGNVIGSFTSQVRPRVKEKKHESAGWMPEPQAATVMALTLAFVFAVLML